MAKKSPAPIPPELKSTTESVAQFTSWVAENLAKDLIKPVAAREFNNLARTMLQQIRTEQGLDELEKLREMLRRAEQAQQDRIQAGIASRGASTSVGEFSTS